MFTTHIRVHVYVCTQILFVGCCLATKVFFFKYCIYVYITGYMMGVDDHWGRLMMKGGHGSIKIVTCP